MRLCSVHCAIALQVCFLDAAAIFVPPGWAEYDACPHLQPDFAQGYFLPPCHSAALNLKLLLKPLLVPL